MNNLVNPLFWYHDANGIRTDYNIGIKVASSATAGNNVNLDQSLNANGSVTANAHVTAVGYVYLVPAAAPTSTEGFLYYDSAAHKLKIRGSAGFETITSV